MTLIDEIATMAEIDETKHSDYLTIMVPTLIEFAEIKCNNKFDAKKPPAGIKLFISESIKHKLKSKGASSRQMGSVSYSYDTDLPEKIIKHLNPYKKLRW